MTEQEKLQDYLKLLRTPFQKLCRLRFLNADGTVAFAVDNNAKNRFSGAFLADEGELSVNLQNGQRRSASVTLCNVDSDFDYNVNTLWFGTEVALDMGMVLSDGTEYYRQMGVFLLDEPTEKIEPGNRTVTYHLVDKWSNLDGTMFGNLEGTYIVPIGTNIFTPITELLMQDKGNGVILDRVKPIFTNYYNGKTQTLPSGQTASMTESAYTLTIDSENGTIAEVVLGLAGMVNAWVGYDNTGALRVDPSQDDISDENKPVLWSFSMNEAQLLSMDYASHPKDVYNDYIVTGEMLDTNIQPAGRAQNLDASSDTNIYRIGRKTVRESKSGYATSTQCVDYAAWKLKRATVLQKSVSVSCTQMFHLEENSLIEIIRTDKPGSPTERHLIQGFTIPLSGDQPMTIQCTSVSDYPKVTMQTWPLT